MIDFAEDLSDWSDEDRAELALILAWIDAGIPASDTDTDTDTDGE